MSCATSPSRGGRAFRAKTYVSVLHAMLWVGLAAVRGLLTEEVSEAEFDVAHPQYTLDGAVAQFAGQGQDIRGEIPKLSVLVVHAVQLASLGGRRLFPAPAADLLGIDFDVVHLLGMHLLHSVDGGVVEHVWPVLCLAQRAEMLARVVQRSINHAADQGHLADWLPVHLVGFRHAGAPFLQAMTGSGAASARRRGDWK